MVLIGNEILAGQVQEANLKWLAEYARQLGLEIIESIIISDEEKTIADTLRSYCQRFSTVVVTGGLGPTEDDLTKQALGKLLQVPLEHSQETESMVREHYKKFGRDWTPTTNAYHIIPKGVVPLFNPRGLAPGFKVRFNKATMLFFPGVPREFHAMAELHLPVSLKERQIDITQLKTLYFRTHRVPEEKIFKELSPGLWNFLSQYGSVSSLPRDHGVDVVVKLSPQYSELKARELLKQPALVPLQPYLWSTQPVTPYELAFELLKQEGTTLATAESCTGGLLAHEFTQLPGVSEVFLGSVVSYANEVKSEVLGVDPELIRRHGAVSEEVVAAMAQGARRLLKSDYALATSGIAGPDGGSADKPVGTLTWALATPKETIVRRAWFPGDRVRLKQRFAYAALFELISLLKSKTL